MLSLLPKSIGRISKYCVNPISSNIRNFSDSKNDSVKPPDNFFDDRKERDLEILDMTTSVYTQRKGQTKIPFVKETIKWDEIKSILDYNETSATEEQKEHIKKIAPQLENLNKQFDLDFEIEKAWVEKHELGQTPTNPKMRDLLDNMVDRNYEGHFDHLESKDTKWFPPEFLNYNVSWRKTKAFPDERLVNLIDPTDPEYRDNTSQDERHCPGKRQRGGKNPRLRCHKIDLDAVNYLDVLTLTSFMTEDSEILSRDDTGLCAKCQRKVARTIRRARSFGVLPHIGDYHIRDNRPHHRSVNYHDIVPNEIKFVSKTIL